MSRIFHRIWKVTLIKQPTGFIGSNPQFFESIGNALEITEHRVRCEIARHLGKEPNTCTMTIDNLGPTTRAEIESGKVTVIFEAGHDGVARHVFTGDRRFAYSSINNATVETKMQIGDGARAYAHARMNFSYKPPVELRTVLQACAASMNLELSRGVLESIDFRQALATGISLHGPTRDVLDRLLGPFGYRWSIQNGAIQILADGAANESEALLINEQAGLIGSPARSPENKNKSRQDVTFDVILKPEIIPGNKVQLESSEIHGLFRVIETTDKVDTHGTNESSWATSVKASPI